MERKWCEGRGCEHWILHVNNIDGWLGSHARQTLWLLLKKKRASRAPCKPRHHWHNSLAVNSVLDKVTRNTDSSWQHRQPVNLPHTYTHTCINSYTNNFNVWAFPLCACWRTVVFNTRAHGWGRWAPMDIMWQPRDGSYERLFPKMCCLSIMTINKSVTGHHKTLTNTPLSAQQWRDRGGEWWVWRVSLCDTTIYGTERSGGIVQLQIMDGGREQGCVIHLLGRCCLCMEELAMVSAWIVGRWVCIHIRVCTPFKKPTLTSTLNINHHHCLMLGHGPCIWYLHIFVSVAQEPDNFCKEASNYEGSH